MAKLIEPLKSQYKVIAKLNKSLRYITDVYYISLNGMIYMHSLVPFIEKIAYINNNENISLYKGIMYLPNELYDFSKDAKISKLTTSESNESITIGQDDNEIHLKLNKIFTPNKGISEKGIIDTNIIPQMYTKLHLIFSDIEKFKFNELPQSHVENIVSNHVIELQDPKTGVYMPFSRNLFPSIKKDHTLSYIVTPLIDEKTKEKKYVLFKECSDEITIYTICAYMNI